MFSHSSLFILETHGEIWIVHRFVKVGKTFSYGSGRLDDNKALADLGFEVMCTASLGFFYIFEFHFQYLTENNNNNLCNADWRLLGCGDFVKKSFPCMLEF